MEPKILFKNYCFTMIDLANSTRILFQGLHMHVIKGTITCHKDVEIKRKRFEKLFRHGKFEYGITDIL